MGKYWNNIFKNAKWSTKSSSNKEPTTEEKLELAFQEIDLLKKRMMLLEHTLEQQLVHPQRDSTDSADYNYFNPTTATANFSTKSLPRYLHNSILPPTSSPTDEHSPAVISCKKGSSVKASVRRHRSLQSNDRF